MSKINNPQMQRWEKFLGLFREKVARSSEDRPTVRYWRSTDLVGAINDIKKEHGQELVLSTFPAAKAALERLEKIGWIKLIPVVWRDAEERTGPQLYRVSLDERADSSIDALELLQGNRSDGIICYFGALRFYELTTQFPPFYHIARLRSGAPPIPENIPVEVKPPDPAKRLYNPLGTEVFTWGETKFYETRRYRSLIPGIQVRLISARSGLRITTLEQSILDTLSHPIHCGGDSVVFEAWEKALDRVDSDRLLSYLETIDSTDLWRRTAVMLKLTEIPTAGTRLAAAIEAKQKTLNDSSNIPEINLLPGYEFGQLDGSWRVRVP
ncbi:MAG: hypothetical protein PSV13_19795 [Lacunisphaera sp.]|nr:hypothetical protein [Lacunisphaera sp.]